MPLRSVTEYATVADIPGCESARAASWVEENVHVTASKG
jgi:hypothetical protein